MKGELGPTERALEECFLEEEQRGLACYGRGGGSMKTKAGGGDGGDLKVLCLIVPEEESG